MTQFVFVCLFPCVNVLHRMVAQEVVDEYKAAEGSDFLEKLYGVCANGAYHASSSEKSPAAVKAQC